MSVRMSGGEGSYLGSERTVHIEDLKTYSQMSQALWANSEYSERSALDTLAAVSLQNLTPERTIERASIALLERARRSGAATQVQADMNLLLEPFFRLTAEERMVLVALHLGRWTYARLGRILKLSDERLQETAWKARLEIASGLPFPAAPSPIGPNCPEYDSMRPWAQKYLDDEVLSGRERYFLQGHLLTCEACHACFLRCKSVYFGAEKQVVRAVGSSDNVELMKEVLSRGNACRNPSEMSLSQSLSFFLERSDVKWSLIALFAAVAVLILKSGR